MRGIVKSAYDHIGKVENYKLKAEIIKKSINGEFNNHAGDTKSDHNELDLFADKIGKIMIKDEQTKLSGKEELDQYHFCIKQLSLSYYLQYRKAIT